MTSDERIAWGAAVGDGVVVLLTAVAVARLESGDPTTTPWFNRVLPYSVAALTPLVVWLGRCHALTLQRRGTFMLLRVVVAGAASGAAVLLVPIIASLLTERGWSELGASVNAPHGVVNTLGAFVILVVAAVFYAGIGAVAALVVGWLNRLFVSFSKDDDARTA
jgi:hypothetical protein